MLRNTRLIVGLCLLTGVSLTAVVGWATGFFARASEAVFGMWDSLLAWINSPMGWDHLMAGAGVLIVPLVVLMIIFAIADG